MPTTKASQAAVARYRKKHYKRIEVNYPIVFTDAIKQAAVAAGQSTQAYIRQAIEERMARDGLVEFLQKVEAYKEDEEDE